MNSSAQQKPSDIKWLAVPLHGSQAELIPEELLDTSLFSSRRWLFGSCDFVAESVVALNDERASKLVIAIVPTDDELALLAKHHLERANEVQWFLESYEQSSRGMLQEQALAEERLATIIGLLGQERAEEILRETNARWKRTFDELRGAPRCEQCGIPHGPDADCQRKVEG